MTAPDPSSSSGAGETRACAAAGHAIRHEAAESSGVRDQGAAAGPRHRFGRIRSITTQRSSGEITLCSGRASRRDQETYDEECRREVRSRCQPHVSSLRRKMSVSGPERHPTMVFGGRSRPFPIDGSAGSSPAEDRLAPSEAVSCLPIRLDSRPPLSVAAQWPCNSGTTESIRRWMMPATAPCLLLPRARTIRQSANEGRAPACGSDPGLVRTSLVGIEELAMDE